jgi:hypothetical protein
MLHLQAVIRQASRPFQTQAPIKVHADGQDALEAKVAREKKEILFLHAR